MTTLTPYELKTEGTHVTQGTDAFVAGAYVADVEAVLTDVDLRNPLLRITAIVLEQSVDDGLTWTASAKSGGWQGDPTAEPLHPGDPLPRPGLLGTSFPNDGRARRFRARLDIPQPMLIGLTISVASA